MLDTFICLLFVGIEERIIREGMEERAAERFGAESLGSQIHIHGLI